MTAGLFLRYTLRESRGGFSRLVFSVVCLAIGVSAVVAISALSTSFEEGFRSNAKELLGADLAVRSQQPLPDTWSAPLAEIPGAEWMVTRKQPQSIRANGSGTLIAELLVVGPAYPYYGDMDMRPVESMAAALAPDRVVVAADLLSRLNVGVGDALRIGDAEFEIASAANSEPDRIAGFMYIGPRVYMSQEGFSRAAISDVRLGVDYTALVKLPDMPAERLEAIDADLEKSLESVGRVRVETFTEGRPSLQAGLDRLARFLGLIALLSLLLGGVGVAQAIRAWIAGRMDAIAILKCVGMRPREILLLYAAQSVLLGLAGSVLGALLGLGFTASIPVFFSEYVPRNLIDPWQPRAALSGMSLGVAVALVFGLPPLIAVLRVPPIRVFRRNAEPLREARWVPVATGLVIAAGVAALAAYQARSALVGTIFTIGVIATSAALAVGAWIVVKLVALFPRDWTGRVWLRHGLAALARPGANTIPSIVALGLGLMVLFCAGLVQNFLNQALTSTLPERVPSAVALNIRQDQMAPLRATLESAGARDVVTAPIVMGRLTAIDGEAPVRRRDADEGPPEGQRDESGREGPQRGGRRREQTVSYAPELPANNTVIEGAWWSKPDVAEMSVEKREADRFGIHVGSVLKFTFGGKEIDFEVSNLRELDWEDIGLNFEYIAEPGYLEEAPQTGVATMWLPKEKVGSIQNSVVAAYPNVTFVPLSDVVERIASQLNKIGWGVRLLGLFIVGAAMAVLAGTVGIDSSRRGREVALLKTVGMTRREVAAIFAAEYALIGLVAGVIGVTGGGIVAWLTLVRAMEADFHWPFGLFALAIAGGILVTVLSGLAASLGALQRRPIEMLRHQE